MAVSANFSGTMKVLKKQFELNTSHKLTVSTGSTGQIFSQIINGAPFDVYLAADEKRPSELVRLGYSANLNTSRTRLNYAQGRLALWTPIQKLDINEKTLFSGQYKKLTIANPKTAPYGKAALEVVNELSKSSKDLNNIKLIYGESLSQTMLFISSKNVDLGFVSLSQIQALAKNKQGSWWLPSQAYYQPIIQQALLLQRGQSNSAAIAFMNFLDSKKAKDIIVKMGYSLPVQPKPPA